MTMITDHDKYDILLAFICICVCVCVCSTWLKEQKEEWKNQFLLCQFLFFRELHLEFSIKRMFFNIYNYKAQCTCVCVMLLYSFDYQQQQQKQYQQQQLYVYHQLNVTIHSHKFFIFKNFIISFNHFLFVPFNLEAQREGVEDANYWILMKNDFIFLVL